MVPGQGILLIEDNCFHRARWESRLAALDFRAFASVADLVAASPDIDRIVFLDYELEDGRTAEENARTLFKMGFRTIFITTAHDPGALEPIDGISGVVAKEPPAWLLPKDAIGEKFSKLSLEERKRLSALMDEEARRKLGRRLVEFQSRMWELPEIVVDSWERAIFEGVSDQDLINRIEESKSYASE